jgi:PncC family amidohydrolase
MCRLRLPEKVFLRLRSSGTVLATAESITGGMIGATITAIPGSSQVYWGGIVSYSDEAKIRLLGVDPSVIKTFGAVSKETAESMARGVLSISTADISIAVTGLAGPGGGSSSVPVGTVWLSLARRGTDSCILAESMCVHLRGSRARIRAEVLREAFTLVSAHLDR